MQHLTCDMWHMTQDMCHTRGGEHSLNFLSMSQLSWNIYRTRDSQNCHKAIPLTSSLYQMSLMVIPGHQTSPNAINLYHNKALLGKAMALKIFKNFRKKISHRIFFRAFQEENFSALQKFSKICKNFKNFKSSVEG